MLDAAIFSEQEEIICRMGVANFFERSRRYVNTLKQENQIKKFEVFSAFNIAACYNINEINYS